MDYEDYEDYEPTQEFMEKINLLVNEEVKSRIKQTVEELESVNHEYHLQSIELSKARGEIRVLKATHEKELKQATKLAQREYWFDCAVGDKVFLLNAHYKVKKCEKCGGKQRVKVIIDSVEVEADCPICGTYKKRQAMQYTEYEIIEGKIERLQIELTANHKWIHIWINDKEYQYEADNRVFRTREECQAAYDSKIKEGETK